MCASGGGEGDDAEPPAPLWHADCAGDLSADTIAEQEALVRVSVDGSIHELIACSGLTFAIVAGLVEGLGPMIASASASMPIPAGFSFDGDGVYSVGSDEEGQTVSMVVKFFDADDVLITENLFDGSTYMVGPSASVDFRTGLEIDFDEAGPQIGVLGFGAAPDSPLVLDALGDILFEGLDDL